MLAQLIGGLEVDVAVLNPIRPRGIHLGRLSGTPDRLDLGRGLRGRDSGAEDGDLVGTAAISASSKGTATRKVLLWCWERGRLPKRGPAVWTSRDRSGPA